LTDLRSPGARGGPFICAIGGYAAGTVLFLGRVLDLSK
jgi:hypothetical protein